MSDTNTHEATPSPRSLPRKLLRWAGLCGLTLFGFLFWVWAIYAIYLSNLPFEWVRTAAAAAWALGSVAWLVWKRFSRRAVAGYFGAWVAVLVWWSLIPALSDRDWFPDVARNTTTEFDGDIITVHNVRNFRYRTEEDYDENWETRVYDLSKLVEADFVVVYWEGNRAIAHTMLSFGFSDGRFLTLSVETRKEQGEEFSTYKGSFKQFELIYLLADDRDLIGLRTNHRGEEVYLYPTVLTAAERRTLLVDILEFTNELAERPRWYATIGQNCTTSLLKHFRAALPGGGRWTWRVLANGYSDERAYQQGRLPQDVPFEELRRTHEVNAAANEIGDTDLDFSVKLRATLPGWNERHGVNMPPR